MTVVIQRPLKGSRISSFYPVKSLPPLSALDSAFQLQEYISLLIRLDVHDVERIVSVPGKSTSDSQATFKAARDRADISTRLPDQIVRDQYIRPTLGFHLSSVNESYCSRRNALEELHSVPCEFPAPCRIAGRSARRKDYVQIFRDTEVGSEPLQEQIRRDGLHFGDPTPDAVGRVSRSGVQFLKHKLVPSA